MSASPALPLGSGSAREADCSKATPRATLDIEVERELVEARLQIALIHHLGPDRSDFRRDGIYWVDFCVTPRRPSASVSFTDHWPAHRQVELGSLVVFPPNQRLQIRNAGGRHASLICQVRAEAIDRHLPADFSWTEHRREACLNVASERLRATFLRLYQEVRTPGRASEELCTALVTQISIELARFFIAVDDPDKKGGLAGWRQKIVDERIGANGPLPTVAELAELCKLSTRQLRRGFRTSHGCSVNDYLAQMRIETAKRRLYSNAPLKEIAISLGYASQANFAGAFRRATGSTPGEFRKRVAATKR